MRSEMLHGLSSWTNTIKDQMHPLPYNLNQMPALQNLGSTPWQEGKPQNSQDDLFKEKQLRA